jgi:hypothetical protein
VTTSIFEMERPNVSRALGGSEYGKRTLRSGRKYPMMRLPLYLACTLVVSPITACDDSLTDPAPRAGTLALRILGDFSAYESALLRLNGEEHRLTRTNSVLSGSVGNVSFGTVELAFELLRRPEVVSGGQVNTKFDVALGSAVFTGSPLEISAAELGSLTPMLSLANDVASALLIDDPCVLETVVMTSSRTVDADRALYGETLKDLITFVFAETSDYDGGNVFDPVQDRQSFDATCMSSVWKLADTLVCVALNNELHCLHYLWERPVSLARTSVPVHRQSGEQERGRSHWR